MQMWNCMLIMAMFRASSRSSRSSSKNNIYDKDKEDNDNKISEDWMSINEKIFTHLKINSLTQVNNASLVLWIW